jgi:phosphoribosylformylglycinamidine cyclo-ligase
MSKKTETYAGSGVNIAKGEAFVDRLKQIARRPGHANLWAGAGGYAAIMPVTADLAVAMTTDGVGTKLLLACEQNNLETIGIDLVAMCANDLICVGATPTSFLDYYATPKLIDSHADALIKGIVEGCDQADMLLVGGETAEMPALYAENHFDIAGFATGTVKKSDLLDGQSIKAGDAIIGISSSGIHSNGLTLARKLLKEPSQVRALMTPTLIYVKPALEALSRYRTNIAGIAHITGGGWRNILRLNKNIGVEINAPLPVPEIFQALAQSVDSEELYRTFNMGMGLTLIASGCVNEIIAVFTKHEFLAQQVGVVTNHAQKVSIKTTLSESASKEAEQNQWLHLTQK